MSCLCTIKAKHPLISESTYGLMTQTQTGYCEHHVKHQFQGVFATFLHSFRQLRLCIHDISNKGDCVSLHQYCMSLLFSSCIFLCGVIFLTGKIFNTVSQCDPHWCTKCPGFLCLQYFIKNDRKNKYTFQALLSLCYIWPSFPCHILYVLLPTHGESLLVVSTSIFI